LFYLEEDKNNETILTKIKKIPHPEMVWHKKA